MKKGNVKKTREQRTFELAKKPFRIADISVILLVALFCLIFILIPTKLSAEEPTAFVYSGGELVYELPLSEDCEIVVKNGENVNTIVIKNGFVFVRDCSCDDLVCENFGKIQSAGERIICLPNQLVIVVVGEGGADVVV